MTSGHSRLGPFAAGGLRLAGAAWAATALAAGAAAAAPPAGGAGAEPASGPRALAPGDVVDLAYELIVEGALGLADARVIALDVTAEPGTPFTIDVPVDGAVRTLRLAPHSNRAPHYELIVQSEDGSFARAAPGPVRTLRGTVDDLEDGRVAGSRLDDGLHAVVDLGEAGRWWLEPVWHLLPGGVNEYVIYRDTDVLPHGGSCAVPDARLADHKGDVLAESGGVVLGGGGPCIAELACDADVEYYNAYGTVAATEARINSVINTVNLQYERDVAITHQITTIVVRTVSDPYTSTDAQTRLCQFITEWTNNQQGIMRDVAHLFTGVDLNGSTIGIAADIGVTGICTPQGGCSGGQFGTFGSYCLSQSDFTGNFSCVTDLTAHELGHLWGAFHCSCSGNTMNSSITCTNNFSAGSVNSITTYRDTRTCLDGDCEPPAGPDNDLCADAEAISCNASLTVDTGLATPLAGGSDGDLPSGSPSCQWQGQPGNTHSTVWYSFLAEDTSVEIETCATTAIQDTIIALYDGSCGSLTELACGEDDCGSTTYMSRICYDDLTPGNTYLVMVGSPGGWSGSTGGVIELDLRCPCPDIGAVAGACCVDGTCVDFQTPASCATLGGTFEGAGSDCGTVICAQPVGGCCIDDACFILTADECAGSNGSYLGDGSDCSGNPCNVPSGACCFGDGTCTVLTAGACSGAGGTYRGDGSDCQPNPCPQPTGACCLGLTCEVLEALDCAAQSGTYFGDGTDCTDSDNDGVADWCDGCPNDPDKTEPGVCGCGIPDTDTDNDGTPDCVDGCPNDPGKTDPGVCGCGIPDTDSDNDGTPDCIDGCPNDPDKTDPGVCGCGNPDTDTDNDGTPDCVDGCPNDPGKTEPGTCGCGIPDDDTDGDGIEDCIDNCPGVFNPGQEDCDGDGVGDACAGEPDCNGNGVPDSCDITNGTSQDENGNGVPDECEGDPGAKLETGTVNVGGTPVTVGLANVYASPVVVCSIQYAANTAPVVTRVGNVTSTSFDVRLQNPSGGGVAADTVSYIVVEEGVWTIDGVDIEARTYNSTVTDENNSWGGQAQSYGQSYSNPVVLGQVMSENDADWSVFWCRAGRRQDPPSSSTIFTGKTVCEDPDVTRANETVGYIVFEAGHGTIGGVAFEAALGGDSVRGVDNRPPFTYAFGTAFGSAPAVRVVTQAAMDGGNGGWANVYGATGATSTSLFLVVDEDDVKDSERRHTTEQVGYVVFQTPVVVP